MDAVVVYDIDYRNGKLCKRDERCIRFPAGSGPRHLTFNAEGTRAYVLTELSSQIFVFAWSSDTGFTFLQQIDLLEKPDPDSLAAAIRMSSDDRFLYASCRGKDVVAVFAVRKDGRLEKVQSISAHGKHPRDILLSENGDFLFAACRDSDAVFIFSRDSESGLLRFMAPIENVPEPIALQII
jgi:6-phosphogluconolactonase